MEFERQQIENKQNYQENANLLENAKEECEHIGLFSKGLINDLRFEFYGDFKREGDRFIGYRLNKDNSLENTESDRPDAAKDVRLLSKEALEKFRNFSFYIDDAHLSSRVWLDGSNMDTIYSFGAQVAHEIAHAKSYRAIPPRSEFFDKERFFDEVADLAHQDLELKEAKIDFSKFRSGYATAQWSELYAMLYQREFIRRDKPSNAKDIKNWDNLILRVADNLDKEINGLGRSKKKDLSPDLIYQEIHTLSFLMPRIIESKFPDFEQRIKFLESFTL
ncbi:MAG: hypothetical protein M1334_02715 [Patescibacteria group bacterium]|nr:hypothetical protein [Patescibacteria group bacterium]